MFKFLIDVIFVKQFAYIYIYNYGIEKIIKNKVFKWNVKWSHI